MDLSKSAWKEDDGLNHNDSPVLTLKESGRCTPYELSSMYDDDPSVFWKLNERKLWLVIFACCVIFLVVLL